MTLQILDVLVSSGGIFLLIASWYFLWEPLAIGHLRQDIFDARDMLFDLVAEKKTTITFDSEVYQGTRKDLNLMIRFSHRLTLFGVLLRELIAPRRPDLAKSNPDQSKLSEEEKKLLDLMEELQSHALAKFFLRSSPLLWVALVIVALFRLFRVLSGGVMACKAIVKDELLTPAVKKAEAQSGQTYLGRHRMAFS